MDSFDLIFLLWAGLVFGSIGVAITIGGYFVKRIMTPKDEVPTANPRVTLRRADLDEQDQRLEALGIKLGENNEQR